QAEDGIRDLTVTGVQTCALPISREGSGGRPLSSPDSRHRHQTRVIVALHCWVPTSMGLIPTPSERLAWTPWTSAPLVTIASEARSEERRVGKEGRPRAAQVELR